MSTLLLSAYAQRETNNDAGRESGTVGEREREAESLLAQVALLLLCTLLYSRYTSSSENLSDKHTNRRCCFVL